MSEFNITVEGGSSVRLPTAGKYVDRDIIVTAEGGGQYEEYTGDYNVTPKVTEQVLLTKNKVMVNDLTVKSIPFYNVSNTSGGNTVYIGNEV